MQNIYQIEMYNVENYTTGHEQVQTEHFSFQIAETKFSEIDFNELNNYKYRSIFIQLQNISSTDSVHPVTFVYIGWILSSFSTKKRK